MIYPASVLVLALGALGISESLLAQDRLPDAEPPLVVSWAPERPGEGELFVVRVSELEGDSIVRITARAGDEGWNRSIIIIAVSIISKAVNR